MDVPEIDVETLDQRRQAGAPVLDVRQPDEYEEAHVPGAVLIPLAELPNRLAEVPAPPVLVICAAGGRSRKAAEYLLASGIDATNVAGGTRAWIEAGKPTVAGTEPG